jgi:formate hydrogenlyase subunit 4
MIAFILIGIISLFVSGWVIRFKSIFSGRKGPRIMQPVSDYSKLLKKGIVISTKSGFWFQSAPIIGLATLIIACAMIPIGGAKPLLSFEGDFILFSALLLAGKFALILGSMETGSSFEGMGVAREALYSLLVEPAFILLFSVLAMLTGQMSFAGIFTTVAQMHSSIFAFAILGSIILFMLSLIENCRLPVDDPKTHLELTMIHEVIILDYSGFDLGIIHLTGTLRMALYGALFSAFFIPYSANVISLTILFFALQLVYALLTGAVESFMARFRMNHNPQFLLALTSIGLLLFFAASLVTGKFTSLL